LLIYDIYKSIMQNTSTRSHSNFVAKATNYSENKGVINNATEDDAKKN